MDVIYRPARTGKTQDLIYRAASRWLTMVVPTAEEAQEAVRKAEELGLNIPQPLTWREFTEGGFNAPTVEGFLIDNLDACLRLSARPVIVEAVTMTERVVDPRVR